MSNKKKAKNSQLVVRINDQERDLFVSLCEELDTSAAREVRRFIRSFILEHGGENTDVSDSAKDSTLK